MGNLKRVLKRNDEQLCGQDVGKPQDTMQYLGYNNLKCYYSRPEKEEKGGHWNPERVTAWTWTEPPGTVTFSGGTWPVQSVTEGRTPPWLGRKPEK